MTLEKILTRKEDIKKYLSHNHYALTPKNAIKILSGFRGEVISTFLDNLSKQDKLTFKQLSCLNSCNYIVKSIIIDQIFRNELEDLLKTITIAYFILSNAELEFLINLAHTLLIDNPEYSLNLQEKQLYESYNHILQNLIKESSS